MYIIIYKIVVIPAGRRAYWDGKIEVHELNRCNGSAGISGRQSTAGG